MIEYSLCKKAAEYLRQTYIGGEIFIRKQMEIEIDNTYAVIHDPYDLLVAYSLIITKEKNNIPVEASVFKPIISKKIVSVTSKIIFVLKKLYNGEIFDMDKLFYGMTERSEKVATFLAVLELTKSGRVILNENNTQISLNRLNRARE